MKKYRPSHTPKSRHCRKSRPMHASAKIQAEPSVTAELAQEPLAIWEPSFGTGATQIFEYAGGKGYGLDWEGDDPPGAHLLLLVLSETMESALEVDVVRAPDRARAVLHWLAKVEQWAPVSVMTEEMSLLMAAGNPPGHGATGTENWRWRGGIFSLWCPPLEENAQVMLAMALPPEEPISLTSLVSLCQKLALIAAEAGIAGEEASSPLPNTVMNEGVSSRSDAILYAGKEQLLANPRSKQIRKLCLEIADLLAALLSNQVAEPLQVYAQLERLDGSLKALGIQRDMHAQRELEHLQDPIILAEYVGGQLLFIIGEHIPTLREVLPILQAFAEKQGGGAFLIPRPGNLPQSAKDFLKGQAFLKLTYHLLDATANEEMP